MPTRNEMMDRLEFVQVRALQARANQELPRHISGAALAAIETLLVLWRLDPSPSHSADDVIKIESLNAGIRTQLVSVTQDVLSGVDLILVTPNDPDAMEILHTKLIRVAGLMEDVFRRDQLPKDLRGDATAGYQDLLQKLSVLETFMELSTEVDKAVTAADAAAESAGAASEQSLSEEFSTLAGSESKLANRFRLATIALFVGTIVYTAIVAYAESADPDWETTQKLALGIPVLLLAGYFGRESSHHRRNAQWASVLVAQLKSIRAYSVELSDADRSALKADFGRRVFLESPESLAKGTDAKSGDGATDQTDVASVLRAAAELARASRGS